MVTLNCEKEAIKAQRAFLEKDKADKEKGGKGDAGKQAFEMKKVPYEKSRNTQIESFVTENSKKENQPACPHAIKKEDTAECLKRNDKIKIGLEEAQGYGNLVRKKQLECPF